MWYLAILVCLVIASYVTVGDSVLPAHYKDLEKLLLSRMNFSADPCNDFHAYACGNSDDYYTLMMHENDRILKNGLDKLISSDQRNFSQTSAIGKTLRLYEACVNENLTKTDAAAYTKKNVHAFLKKFNFPIDFFFDDNANVTIDRKMYSNVLKYVHDTFFIEPFFHIYGAPAKVYAKEDSKNFGILVFTTVKKSFEALVYECDSPKLLETFIQGVRNVHAIMGLTAAEGKIKKTAQELMEFELRLTKISCGRNNITITTKGRYLELESLTYENVGIDLNNYVRGLIETGIGNSEVDLLIDIDFLREVLENTSDVDLLRYIYFRIVSKNAVEIDCIDVLAPMKLVKSRIYTESKYTSVAERENFSNNITFTDVIDIVKKNLQNMVLTMPWVQQDADAYNHLLKKFENMRAEVAIEKNMLNDTWLDQYYDAIRFNGNDSFFDLYSKAQHFDIYEAVRWINRDATDFEDDLTTVNAGFRVDLNKIVMDDGYLVAPNYHKNYEFSYNFGSIASVIGHEIGHSVDAVHREYNEKGFWRLVFQNSTITELEKMIDCVIDQYNKIQVLPDNYTINHVNGEVTFDESLADISGVEAAFLAFEDIKSVGNLSVNPSFNDPKLRGLTHDQLFFLGSVNTFCSKQNYDVIQQYVTSGRYAPNAARVQGLSNVPAFGKAFNCPVGSKYCPAEYCRVWTTPELSLIDLFLSLTSIFFNVFEH